MKNLFLLDPNITYLNHGSYGSCPSSVFNDYQKLQKRLEQQPVQFMTKYLWKYLKESRDTLGTFLNCDGDDLLLFANPTTAINNVIENLNLNKGDEVLMTQHEYGALVRAWSRSSKRNNFSIVQQPVNVPVSSKKNFIKQFLAGITVNTKVVFISQITSQTGLIFPIKEICEYATKKGIVTIVDGAHVPGHIDLNISNLECDFFTGTCHKWLCAPKGSSFLYVRKSFQANIKPQVVSWGEEGDDPGPSQFQMDFQWQGTNDMSSFLSIPSAIHFIESNNWKENHKISKELILEVSEDLKNLFGTNPLFKSEDWVGQMVSHPLPSNTPENLKEMLWEKFLIEVPVFEWKKQKYIRVSAHFYNDRNDMNTLINALKMIF
ncbi:aminotransferase class V-fold PLP-dependent enzyme [Candidatus Marinimicrobia bacterium]|nr:aminotransferase class V-fold PLP-dependent enzyme [Candidatus Neomarinimicrobiota bacterium]